MPIDSMASSVPLGAERIIQDAQFYVTEAYRRYASGQFAVRRGYGANGLPQGSDEPKDVCDILTPIRRESVK